MAHPLRKRVKCCLALCFVLVAFLAQVYVEDVHWPRLLFSRCSAKLSLFPCDVKVHVGFILLSTLLLIVCVNVVFWQASLW